MGSGSHADRDAQFIYINERVNEFMALAMPVISVNCKKKIFVSAPPATSE